MLNMDQEMNNNRIEMNYLFHLLTSKKAVLRQFHPSNRPRVDLVCVKMKDPFNTDVTFSSLYQEDYLKKDRLKFQLSTVPIGGKLIKYYQGVQTLIYSFAPWCPVVANMRQLPFLKDSVRGRRMPLLRLLDKKPGLADITRETSRIKAFRLQDAILYSYILDLRFILVLCLALGFSIWWAMAPESLLLKPEALASPNIRCIYNVIIDTFVTKVCSTHPNMSLPCECGSPLNNEVRELFAEPTFDPLLIDKGNPARMRALAVYFASILIVLALSESASHHGVYLNLS